MNTSLHAWPDTHDQAPPSGHLYASATWLLGRHPRLARLAARVFGVVGVEDDELVLDLDHLADVIAAAEQYGTAWEGYENMHPAPAGEHAYERWWEAGPTAEEFARGLSDFLVMSSGEVASLRLLATLASTDCVARFGIGHLRSMDAEGQRLVADWCAIIRAH